MTFTSKREKRLWTAVAVVVVGIYSLIFIGRPLSGYLRERELLTNGFWLAIVLVLATVLWYGWKRQAGALEIGMWLGVFAIYLLVLLRMAVPEERSHLIEYSVLAVFIHEALLERNRKRKLVNIPGLVAIGITIIVGLVDECIQLFVPGRVFDPIDIAFNSGAAVFAIVARSILQWSRKKLDKLSK
ncbi:MAG: VanZ family protein [Flavobacteriaceae bacterium]